MSAGDTVSTDSNGSAPDYTMTITRTFGRDEELGAVRQGQGPSIHWQRLLRRRAVTTVATIMLLTMIVMGTLAPLIAPYGPLRTRVGPRLTAPCREYLMGTDHLGRDVFSGFVYGARVSMFVGVAAALMSAVIGVVVGLPAGYRDGRLDDILMRFTEIFQVIPLLIAALVVTTLIGGKIINVVAVISLLSWPSTARIIRAEALSLRTREFVLAAKLLGMTETRVMLRHILPNSLGPVIVNTTLQIGSAVLIEAGLSFMGVGDPNHISWGQQLQNAQRFLRQAWWMAFFPGMAIFLTVLSFNLLGDFVYEVTNPLLIER